MTLQTARDLLERPIRGTEGVWARAVAVLIRQALEGALATLWARKARGLEAAPVTVQLHCLPAYLDDDPLAAEAAYTWSALSAACHHHGYALPPTAVDLAGWLAVTERLTARIRK